MAGADAIQKPALDLPGSFQEAQGVETQTSLNRAVWERRSEYTQPKTIRVKVGTWNVAAIQGTEKDLGGWFVHGKGVSEGLSGLKTAESGAETGSVGAESISDQESRRSPKESTLPRNDPGLLPKDKDIGLYVLGLQEIVDVSSPVETVRPYADRGPSERWKSAVLAALPTGYSLVAEQQLVGMFILIYASREVAATVSNVSCRAVGTGLMGYMGNKGAVVVRLVLGETTRVVFVNSHLSAGAEKSNMDRRNWDAGQVVERTRFDAIDHGHGVVDEVEEAIGDEDFCFWFGDLNYRLAHLPGQDIRRLLMLHTKGEYEQDKTKENAVHPSSGTADNDKTQADGSEDVEVEVDPDHDPASMQTTIASLLPHDELHDQMRKKVVFHDGWQEGKIRFMPTYKYDIGSVGMFDSSEKKRAPSWCDRILYRTRRNLEDFKTADRYSVDTESGNSSSKKDQTAASSTYDYDPDEDAEDPVAGASEQSVTTKTGFEDSIELEYYTSHHRVLSSDHKPLDAVFQLTYQAIDPVAKAAVYALTAKEFDRFENESRPSLAVAVDTHEGKSTDELIDFGDLRFGVPLSRTVTIANTGRNTSAFSFVVDGTTPWLSAHCEIPPANQPAGVSPEFRINPGDALTATVTAHVNDPANSHALNCSSSSLEHVLVLRVVGGRDHFLTIRGNWLRSCLGMSMAELVRTPEGGARSVEAATAVVKEDATSSSPDGASQADGAGDGTVRWSAPRELFRLTEALEANVERAVAEWGMMGGSSDGGSAPWDAVGWPLAPASWALKNEIGQDTRARALAAVRDALDTGREIDGGGVDALQGILSAHKAEIFAEVLLQFLDCLQDGIITEATWSQIRELGVEWERAGSKKAPDRDARRVAVLEVVATSTPHNVSFTLVAVMLRRMIGEIAGVAGNAAAEGKGDGVARELEKRKVTQAAFIEVLQRVLFRPKADGATEKEVKRTVARRTAMLELFVEEGIN